MDRHLDEKKTKNTCIKGAGPKQKEKHNSWYNHFMCLLILESSSFCQKWIHLKIIPQILEIQSQKSIHILSPVIYWHIQ